MSFYPLRSLRRALFVIGLVAWLLAAQASLAQAVNTEAEVIRLNVKPNVKPNEVAAIDSPKSLGTITVTGLRPDGQPSSLPEHISTTIEGINARQIAEKINATDAEDALKYFPSLLVRKRFIGDFDHAVLASRASGTGNSARSLVYADGILLSNLLGNGANFTPRWGLVTPEEIDRVDVLYGPFSAAYSGNSVGAVVDYVTRMPTKFEMHAGAGAFTQRFKQYGTDARFSGSQESISVGNKNGALSWWINFNHLQNDSQPIAFANKLIAQGTLSATGVPVTGAIADRNPKNQDWFILGATNAIDTMQDHAKVKLAYDISPHTRVSYTVGIWRNDVSRDADSYLRDTAGNQIWSGNINVGGRQYSVAPTDFSLSRADLTHVMHGASIKQSTRGVFDWEIAASVYDYQKDLNRAALNATSSARNGGAGRITDMNGTGWNTLSLKGAWRPVNASRDDGEHLLDMGLQRASYQLRTLVSDTGDWINGSAEKRFSAFQGNTLLTSAYVQDTWRFADAWRTTLGARAERWEASNGAVSNALNTLILGERKATYISPKLALAYQARSGWILKTSLGRAVRNPTVSELYQGSIANETVVNNDPHLKPEKSWTGELTAERELNNIAGMSSGSWRNTLFFEDTRDALYSQIDLTAGKTVATIQNIDHIRTKGFESSLVLNDVAIKGFDVIASLTFADSIIVRNDKFLASVSKRQPRVPKWRANLLATWRANDQLSTTLGVRYSGKQFNTLDNSDPNSFTYTGTSSFLVADVRLRYKFDQRWSAAIGIDNLNNEKYWNFHPYPHRTFLAELKFDLN